MMTPSYAEDAVLGGVLVNNAAFHEVSPLVSAEMFTSPFRRRVWEALRERILAGEAADSVTVAELMPNEATAIFDMGNNAFTGRSGNTYAKIVRENWQRREAAQIAQRLLASVREGE